MMDRRAIMMALGLSVFEKETLKLSVEKVGPAYQEGGSRGPPYTL